MKAVPFPLIDPLKTASDGDNYNIIKGLGT